MSRHLPDKLWFLWQLWVSALVLVGCLVASFASAQAPDAKGPAWVLTLEGPIGPAVADYLIRGIDQAEQAQAPLVIIRMDTPGGLDLSMRDIIQRILAASVPVVSYVSPDGARAASAGTFLLYASHIAAMAPSTTLGAATPVAIGAGSQAEPEATETSQTALSKKQINDAVAYIRELAALRGRNADWAEQAVREAASLGAQQALEQRVIDLQAKDMTDLLAQLHGREITIGSAKRVLDTQGLSLAEHSPDWRSRLLAVITNPSLAYVLMMIGIYGLIYEFSNPGIGGPGIIGVICLLLALYAFQMLPVNYLGIALIVLGLTLMVSEAFVPSFGVLGVGGALAFVLGSFVLMDTQVPAYQIGLPLIAGFAVMSLLVCVLSVSMALRAHRRKALLGADSWVGALAEALDDFDRRGHVRIQGETWQARTSVPVQKGQQVRVQAVHDLVLDVMPTDQETQ